jgi:uncharacterized protein (DUF302 family)
VSPLQGITVSVPLSQAEERLRQSLASRGFGVLARIDIAGTLAEKVGASLPETVILEVCNPRLAAGALEARPEVAALLPCSVALRAVDGGTRVELLPPATIAEMLPGAGLEPVAHDADDAISTALAELERDLAVAPPTPAGA